MSKRVLVTIGILVFGGVCLWFGLRMRAGAVEGVGWPTTQATILDKRAEPRANGKGYLHLRYRYEVAGKPYVSERVYALGRELHWMKHLEREVAELPATIAIHYDPADPANAYVYRLPGWSYWIPIVFGVVLLLIGVVRLLAGGAPSVPPPRSTP